MTQNRLENISDILQSWSISTLNTAFHGSVSNLSTIGRDYQN